MNQTTSLIFDKKRRSELLLNVSRYSAICAATLGTFSTAMMSLFAALMLLAWIASAHFLKIHEVIEKPVGLVLAVFVSILIVGMFYSIADWPTRADTLWSWRKLIYIFIFLGIFNSLFWKQRFITVFVVGMGLAMVLSYLAWFELIPSKRQLGIIASNYTVQSMAFVAATICCIIELKNTPSTKARVVYLALITLFVINILYISESRTGYVSLFAGSFVASLYAFGKKKMVYIVVVGVLVAMAAMNSQTFQDRLKLGMAELQSYEESPVLTSIGVRVVFVQNTLELIKERPLLGYGTGAFETAYAQQVESKYTNWRAKPTTDPHNQYLYVWTENGLLGLVAFLSFIVVAIRQGIISGDKYGAIGVSVLCAWVVSALFNSTFKTMIEGHLLGLFLGVMLACVSRTIPK